MEQKTPFRRSRFFTEEDARLLRAAMTYRDLWYVAYGILERMPDGIHIVSGPIATGGYGFEENIRRFNRAIDILDERGYCVFSQMEFEEPTRRIQSASGHQNDGMCLMRGLYLPILNYRKVTTVCFLKEYNQSFGAQWEHDLAGLLRHRRMYFVANFESVGSEDNIFEDLRP